MLKSTVALFRPKDHIFFTIPIVILGYAMGAKSLNLKPELGGLALLLIANILAISFAFAINEIEDAEDDKKDPTRKNPVARGAMTKNQAIALAFGSVALSSILFALFNSYVLSCGLGILALAFLYSFKPVRLKSTPILDLISHSLMLAGLIFLSSYFALSRDFTYALPFFLGATLFSIYGQFYNQLRDYKEDKVAKLSNSTILLGKALSKNAMYLSIFLGAMGMLYCFYNKTLPLFLIPLTIISTPFIFYFTEKILTEKFVKSVRLSRGHIRGWVFMNLVAIAFFISLYL